MFVYVNIRSWWTVCRTRTWNHQRSVCTAHYRRSFRRQATRSTEERRPRQTVWHHFGHSSCCLLFPFTRCSKDWPSACKTAPTRCITCSTAYYMLRTTPRDGLALKTGPSFTYGLQIYMYSYFRKAGQLATGWTQHQSGHCPNVHMSVADLGEGQGGRPPPGSESGPKWAPLGPLE